MKLKQQLFENRITEAMEDLGFSTEEIFFDLTEESDDRYARYTWQKVPCSVEGVDQGYVIHAVPTDFTDAAWEEWYISAKRPVHHILFAAPQPVCTDEAVILQGDMDHPAAVTGKKWYYYEDTDMRPYFARKSV